MFTNTEIKNLMKNSTTLTYDSLMKRDVLEQLNGEEEKFHNANIIRELSEGKCDSFSEDNLIAYYLSDVDNIQQTIREYLKEKLFKNKSRIAKEFKTKNLCNILLFATDDQVFRAVSGFFLDDYNETGIFGINFPLTDSSEDFNVFDSEPRDNIFNRIRTITDEDIETRKNQIKQMMANSSILKYEEMDSIDIVENIEDEDDVKFFAEIIRPFAKPYCDDKTDLETVEYYLSDIYDIQRTIRSDLMKRLRDNRDMLIAEFKSGNTIKSVVNDEEIFQSIFEFLVVDYNEHGIFSMDFPIDNKFNLFDSNNRDIIFEKINLKVDRRGTMTGFTKSQFTTGVSGSLLFKNASSLVNGLDEYVFEHTGINPDDGEPIYDIKIIKYDVIISMMTELFKNHKNFYRPDIDEDETSLVEYNVLSSKQSLKIFGPSIDDIITSIILDLEKKA